MAARKKSPTKPEPIAVTTICSVCGLLWLDHGEDPTTDDCIRLLKAELAKKPITIPSPYPVRPSRPWYWEEWNRRPHRPGEITWPYNGSKEMTYSGQTFKENTPRLLTTSCKATSGSFV